MGEYGVLAEYLQWDSPQAIKFKPYLPNASIINIIIYFIIHTRIL